MAYPTEIFIFIAIVYFILCYLRLHQFLALAGRAAGLAQGDLRRVLGSRFT